jgi:DHA2 family multidrug resistance protein-like MFS transporter
LPKLEAENLVALASSAFENAFVAVIVANAVLLLFATIATCFVQRRRKAVTV